MLEETDSVGARSHITSLGPAEEEARMQKRGQHLQMRHAEAWTTPSRGRGLSAQIYTDTKKAVPP